MQILPRNSAAGVVRLALSALLFPLAVAALLVIPESRAQVPMDLVVLPGQPHPDTYNPADPRFSEPELCAELGGEIRVADTGEKICSKMDENGTFCIVGSSDAFPCRGLYKHTILCNGGYNRKTLNPFFCGKKCSEGQQRARGGKCENVIPPRQVVSPAARSVRYVPAVESTGESGALIIAQADALYTLALPENLNFDGQRLQNIRIAQPDEIPPSLAEPQATSTVLAKISCPECYPGGITIVAEFQPAQGDAIRPAESTVVALNDVEVMITLSQQEVNVMVTLAQSRFPTVIIALRESTVTQTIFRQNEFPPITRPEDHAHDNFYAALKYDDVETARQLIVEGLNYFERDGRDRTYLHQAAVKDSFGFREGSITGAPKIAALLISLGVYVNATDNAEDTALHHAIASDNLVVATILVNNRANVNAQNINGITPLFLAVGSNRGAVFNVEPDEDDRVRLATFLLDNGANVNLKNLRNSTCYANNFGTYFSGCTPLHIAAFTDAPDVARLLIARGADPLIEDGRGKRPCEYVGDRDDLHTMGILREC